MIPAIPSISSVAGAVPTPASAGAAGAAATGGDAFSSLLGNAIDQANQVQQSATTLALQGATGQANIADVTVAATEAQLSVQLVTAIRDRAVTAFNSIMTMSA